MPPTLAARIQNATGKRWRFAFQGRQNLPLPPLPAAAAIGKSLIFLSLNCEKLLAHIVLM